MCSCVVETSSVVPRKSRLFSLMLGNVWKLLCRLRTTIGGSLEIFKKDLGNLWKTIHRSRHYFVYIISKLINSCYMEFIFSCLKNFSLFTLFQWLSILCGPQSLWTLLFYYLHELLKLFITVTCFTLCSIKSWCTAAFESVHSVCTGPVVLTGPTRTLIDLCFRGWDWKDLKCNCLCC